jgi:putative transposase
VSENLLEQDFYASGPNQKWAGDITYLRTDEGWLYLAVVIDLWSRAVIGWSMSPRMTAQLVCDALQMALWRRKRPRNVIVLSDRCSADYQALLKQHNLRGSMSTKGCCYDNVSVESFFHSRKVECLHGEHFISREIMRATVFNYIECDNNRWRGQDHLTRFCFQIMWLVRRTNHKVYPLIFIDQKTYLSLYQQ